MADNYFDGIIRREIDDGLSNAKWWDESRIPLDTIDKPVTDLLNLRGRKAIVTGGAGLNLGQACVNRLAGLGADVAVVDLAPDTAAETGRLRWATPPDAKAVAEQAAKRWGTDVFPVHGDVMDWDDIQRIMADCHDRMGRIDILVNSAADAVMGDFATLSREEIDRTVRGSMLGTMYCTRAALDYMIPQGGGKIINVGSESSLTAIRGQVVYGTSKAGLNAFNAFLGKEVAVHGVQVLGVNPGCMWGPDRPLQTPSPFGLYAIGRSAIQRYELPEEVANMVAFLASDASSCMAGETINMGGGMAL